MAGFGQSTPNTNKPKVSQNGPQLLEAAVKAHKKGDIRSAESLYLEAINIGFDHEIAFSNLGLIYKNTNRQSEAILIYERAITKNPNLADAHSNLGNVYKDLGNLDQALASTLKSLELKPDNPDALINLGGIYQDLGNLDQALASTLKSLDLKPDNPTAHMNLGNIYKDLGQLDQALAATLKSLELKPDNPTAHMNLGGIYKELGKNRDAFNSSLKSIQLKPIDNLDAYNNLVSILQLPREKDSTAPANPIEEIDIKIRNMGNPTIGEGKININDIDKFIEEAINIAAPLEGVLTTTLTQIYHRTKTSEPNCKSFIEFFESQNSIAQRCHNCYKVQIEVSSLDELIILNFLMKTLRLKNSNTRKCMVELRKHAKGSYKGLIYCSEINEAESVANEASLYISERSKIKPILTVKRGCTEFTNAHKGYGEIGHLGNLHQGRQQRKEWELNEKRFLGGKSESTIAEITGWEFNLGELLILKNWILYALAMEDAEAIAKYGNINYDNKTISKAIDQKRSIAL